MGQGSGLALTVPAELRRALAQRAGQTKKAGAQAVPPVEQAESKNKKYFSLTYVFTTLPNCFETI
jgi:hypothetical protein